MDATLRTMLISCAALGCVSFETALAADDCPPQTQFGFELDGAGSTLDPDGSRVLDLFVEPGAPLSFEVTAYLVTNPAGSTATVDRCGLFTMFVAHDQELIRVDQVAGALDSGFFDGRPLDGAGQHGFVAGAAICLAPSPIEFTGRLELITARYTLIAPHESAGATLRSELRFESFNEPPRHENEVEAPGVGRIVPCLRALSLTVHVRVESDFIRGDSNLDGRIDISDPVTILRALFYGDASIHCEDAADSNDSGDLDISDAVHLFAYLFLGGAEPDAPFPGAGPDRTADVLGCAASS